MIAGRHVFILLLVVATLFSAAPLRGEQEEGPLPLASLVPEETRVYFSFPSLSRAWEGFRTLPLYEAYCDEEVQAFFDSLDEGMSEMLSGKRSDFVRGILDLPGLFKGEAAFALVPREDDEEEHDWIVSLAAGGESEAAERFVDKTVFSFLEAVFPWGPGKEEIAGNEVTVFKGPSNTLHLCFVEGRLLLSDSSALLKRLLSGPGGEGKSLAETRSFDAAWKRLGGKDASFLIHFSLNRLMTDEFFDLHKKEKALLKALGLADLESVTAVLTQADGRARETIWLQLNKPPQGILEIFGEPPLDIELARLAPDSTVLLLAGNVSLADVYQAVLGAAREHPDEMVDEMRRAMRNMEKQLGLRSLGDLIGLLGTEVMAYAALPDGGGFIPMAALVFEVLEPERLQTNLHSLWRTLSGQEPKTLTYRGRQIHYLPSTGRDFFELSACWCITDGYLLLSYHPLSLKGLVARLDKGKRTLRTDQEFEAAWKNLPDKAVAVGYADSQRLFRYLYGLVLTFVPMMGDDVPFDPAMLPSTDCVADYLSSALSGLTSEETGIVVQTESDGYGPTSLALYGVVAWIIWTPIEEWDNLVFEYPSCARRQKSIRHAMELFREEHQRYPKDIPELLEGNYRSFGSGCFAVQRTRVVDTPEQLESLLASQEEAVMLDFKYVVAEKKIEPPSEFPDDWMILWDSEPRHNDGRVVLLGNGEPTWLPEAEFQKRLKEQGP